MMNIYGNKSKWLAHFLAWLGGVLWALSPFIHAWELIPHMPMRLGRGQFGFNLMIFSFLFLIGGMIGGYWWRLCRWVHGGLSRGLLVCLVLWFLCSIVAAIGLLSQSIYYCLFSILFIGGVILAYFGRLNISDRQKRTNPVIDKPSVTAWLSTHFNSNILFIAFFFLSVWGNNVLAALKLDISTAEFISVVIGRFFFVGFLALGLFFIIEMCMRSMPKHSRWLVWSVFSMLPILVIADAIQSQLYGRSVFEILNNLTSNGEIDVEKELDAGGFGDISVTLVVVRLIITYIASCLLAYALWIVSKKIKFKVTFVSAFVLMVVFYALSVGEQAIGKSWKNLSSWQQENKLFMLNQGLVKPKLGLATFAVEFKDYQFVSDAPSLGTPKPLPDIYIFMVESMRHDSMDPKTTPFLMEFMEDCQPLETTWSGSNATHLSWYSIFYSKPSLFWMQEMEGIKDKETYRGAPILNELNKMGYSLEVRAVCNLGYKDFGLLNFGNENMLCDVLEHVEDGNELDQTDIPGREKIVFNRLRESVISAPKDGGKLFFTALDSPHYNYYWDDHFNVPYADYKGDISFPLFPSKEEVKLYHNRYLNAVAWVDHQLMEFCSFLKKEGKYDNSIIIVTGDHGEEFQEDGGWCHCTSLMPEQTKVPILIKWPATMVDPPARKLASHLDIFPSICSYLGISDKMIKSMAGANLLSKDENNTVIVATAFANKNGETMFLKRNGYTAYFSWSRPWEPRVPSEIRLERIVDSEGNLLKLKKGTDYRAKLRELYPDAFERYFKSLEKAE